jgi:hypothetical protein
LSLAPQNDLVELSDYNSVMQHLHNPSRYITVLKFSYHTLADSGFGFILLFLFAVNVYLKRKLTSASVLLLTVAVCYFFVYILTPKELNWHLETSLVRLLLHIIPATLFVLADFGSEKTFQSKSF